MRRTRWMALTAMGAAVVLTVTACGGDAGDDDGDNTISIGGTNPENPLIPGDTNEAGGGKIVDAMFTGLVNYDPETADAENAHAEEIDMADDGTEVTFTLKEGWTFHDGTEVKAENYVKAWNHTANKGNGFKLASFFEQIKGFDDVQGDDDTDKEMEGLTVDDDYTFTVEFEEPHPIFVNKLGYSAYMPLPDAFFEDPEAFENEPIGNGPFQFTEQAAGESVTLEAFEEYQGDDAAQVDGVEVVFGELEDHYKSVQDNNLDFTDTLPPVALAGEKWKEDLPERSDAQDALIIQAMTFPMYNDKFESKEFRHAVSMAIDREEVTNTLYEGTRTPATGYAVENVNGWEEGACGEYCEHNPDKAKELFDESGYEGTIQITSNTDGGHKEWVDAVCGQISNTLETECEFVPATDFGTFRDEIDNREMDMIYRAGWQADYSHIENFLNPIYRTNASSNDGEYSNPDVDSKLAEADTATDEEEANKLYHEAEEMIAEDMPGIPLWSQPAIYGWSERLDNVQVSALTGELDLASVTVNGGDE